MSESISDSDTSNRVCFLCGPVINSLTLFHFPKDSLHLKQWLQFCSISPEEYRNSMQLCAAHFPKYSNGKTRSIIEESAVPTIHAESEREYSRVHQESADVNKTLMITRLRRNLLNIIKNAGVAPPENSVAESVESNEGNQANIDDRPNSPEKVWLDVDDDVENESEVSRTILTFAETKPQLTASNTDFGEANDQMHFLALNSITDDAVEDEVSAPAEAQPFVSLKRTKALRYVGDISSAHLDCPRTRSACLYLFKFQHAKMKKQIVDLKRKNRRLEAKVASLKDALINLEEKKFSDGETISKYVRKSR